MYLIMKSEENKHVNPHYILSVMVFISLFKFTSSGPNDLHLHDGATMAEIIGGDIFFEIIDPLELEYTYRLRPAKDFGATFNESLQLKNTPLVPAKPIDACNELENIDDIEGNVALIERGKCTFKRKTIMAERAGARAVIITDLDKGSEENLIEMIDDETSDEVHIPAGFLIGKNGLMITHTLNKLKRTYAIINLPVNLTFTPVNQLVQPPWIGW